MSGSELKFHQIDVVSYPDHASLRPDDTCYCLGEYTAHRGNSFSLVNQIIENLKIKPSASDVELRSKAATIRTVADAFRSALMTDQTYTGLKESTFVPVPPSRIHGDPLYDDRMLRLLFTMGDGLALDIRELVKQRKSTEPARGSEARPSVSEIAENYYVDDSLTNPPPTRVWVFDDVLTGGNHYKAMQLIIRQCFPMVTIAGMFVARRVPEEAARLNWRERRERRDDAGKSPNG